MLFSLRKINRLKGFDYSSAGYYFVTICVQDRVCCFGKIVSGEMVLNNFGKIVKKQWLWLNQQYPYVELDESRVMPNHFHGILIVKSVGTGRDLSLQKQKPLPELIGAFKTTSSKFIHQSGLSAFSWQRSYYDHVIRSDADLNRIREYIRNNPKQWELDEENPKNSSIRT